MSATVIMPQLGETVAEGKILTWFKSVGDEIREGDSLFEVETDKVTVEVTAIAAGRLSEILVGDGTVAKVGAVVARIGDGAELPKSDAPKPAPANGHAADGHGQAAPPQPAMSPFEEVATPRHRFGPAKGPDGIRLTPLARRLIAQNGLSADAVSRRVLADGGRVVRERDVRAMLSETPAAPAPAHQAPPSQAAMPPAMPAQPTAGSGGELVALNAIRQRTGERLAENWRTIPHVFQAIETDFTAVDAVRARHKERFRAEHGMALTYLPFIARAVCLALRDYPQVNARLEGAALRLSAEVHLGIAVDLSHNGLVVPVVRGAGDLTVPGLARAIGRVVEKARTGRLSADDFSGGTYSISNNGAFGTSFTAAIINAPQVAILSSDAIRKKPAVVSTQQGDFIAVRPIGMVGQSFDHRAFDGAYSAAYLSRVREIIEERSWESEFS